MFYSSGDNAGAGIDAARETTLMWIAKFALTEPLPLEWEEYAPFPRNMPLKYNLRARRTTEEGGVLRWRNVVTRVIRSGSSSAAR